MNVTCIGAGPAGLYASILLKKLEPASRIRVIERNRPDDTFGWGVVFSEETLAHFREADPETHDAIRARFAHWTDIETYFRDTCVTSTGHGFSGLERKELLAVLQERARGLGIELEFQREMTDLDALGDADLVLGADGIQSLVRRRYEQHFRPSIDWRKAKFCWLGTTRPLRAFTFVFEPTEFGLFQVHAYPFKPGLSTWIVECHEDVWRRAGLDKASEEETVAFCERIFAAHLDGHPLLTNRSIWRTFPTVRCERWHHENVVLLGDAAHTAHFSIGSGTKLAMEDAIALRDAFHEHGTSDIPRVLAAYQEARDVDVSKIQRAAQVSLEWFEHSDRYLGQDPELFTFNLMTRSKRITYDNLKLRDPALVERATERFRVENGAPLQSDGRAPAPAFTPYRLRGLELANRIVVSPMCQYSAKGGTVGDWHLVHLGSRAIGGAGLVITEMTDVEPEGRITHGCAGLWSDEHEGAWRRIVDFVHTNSRSAIGIQLAHAGRKASCEHPWNGNDVPLRQGGWQSFGPSAEPFKPDWPAPREMDRADMDRVRDAFVAATRRAERAGFDLVELHAAHGYLLSSFLSPLSNLRRDDYGGSLENRARFPLEVIEAVRAVWPDDKPLAVRITASDWRGDEGFTPDEAVAVAKWMKALGVDVIDVSSGGNVARADILYGRMYQVPFAEKVRYEAEIPVMAVGAIQGIDHANTVLAAGRADLCALARPHLYDPYLTLHGAAEYGFVDQEWPGQYLAGRTPPPR